MLTMAGNRGPMMVETRGLKEVNLVQHALDKGIRIFPHSRQTLKSQSGMKKNLRHARASCPW